MKFVTFYKQQLIKDVNGEFDKQTMQLGNAIECDVTPFKRSKITDSKNKTNYEYTSKKTTKVFLYERLFEDATHFEVENILFEVENMNDYNDENILCFEGVCYERN
ncbi:MAG: hypothetical protein ACRC17_02015 [Culicoidibacterales bacterium]